jgi:hypothetical protein
MRRPSPVALMLVVLVCESLPLVARSARAADPTTLDCLTANESSLTLRSHLDLRATRSELLICSMASCPADIRNECIRRMGEVNVAIPTIVFQAMDAAGHNLIAVTVKMDGALLAERLEGTALSIDPGQHTFTFEVAGQPVIQQQLLIFEGEKDRRERITFNDIGKVASSNPSRGDAPGSSLGTTTDGRRARLGRARIASLALAGVGVVGLGVGTAFALTAISRRDTASAICPAQCTDGAGVDAWNRARSAGDVATVGFVAGAAGLATGIALWLLSDPPDRSGGTQVSLGPGLVEVVGRW